MADVDLTQIESSKSTKLVGSTIDGVEETPIGSTENRELYTYDVANSGGIDSVITIPAGGIVELKVLATTKLERKFVMMQALGKGIKWGHSDTSFSFHAFKYQFFILPFGPNTSVFFKNESSGSSDIAIGES